MMYTILLSTIFIIAAYYIIKLGRRNEYHFLRQGLTFEKPHFLIGNCLKFITKQTSKYEFFIDILKIYPKERMVGFFYFRKPYVIVLDPEIAKQLAVKEFDHFSDRKVYINQESDPLFSNSIFQMQGQRWRDMRSTLSPAFTGSKMRLMCDLVVEIGEQMVDFLSEKLKEGPQVYEAKELCSKITFDIIGTSAFGIKVDSLKNKDNDFIIKTKKFLNFFGNAPIIKFIFFDLFPNIFNIFNISFFDKEGTKFLKNMIITTMRTREENNIIRPDMIHLLMEAQKGNLKHTATDNDPSSSAGFATATECAIGLSASKRTWSEDEIVAQCFFFLLAGFDTSSTVLSFAIYELMLNPDVQDKLFDEISELNANLGGKPPKYDTLQNLKYLDMVVSETLRKWPPGPAFDRICNRDYTLKYDEKEYTFHKGDIIWIPVLSFQRNPEFFTDPDKFDPERFSDDNKHLINPSTYIPFGIGPRNCIGSRFALMALKSILYYLILNFRLEVTQETQIPLKLAKSLFSVVPEKEILVSLRSR